MALPGFPTHFEFREKQIFCRHLSKLERLLTSALSHRVVQ